MFPGDSGLESKVTLERGPGNVIEELPFRILMLGDWSGDGEKAGLEGRRPVEIDRDNFDEVMDRLGVRLDMGSGDGAFSLEFRKLDDFHPDEIFARLPVFSELRDLRRRLKDTATFNSAAREVRGWFAEDAGPPEPTPAEAAPQPAGNLLDAILSEPSGGAPAPRPAVSGELSSLISDLVRPHIVSVDEDEQAKMIGAVDEATSGLMRNILHDARFQELEAAWRGLYLQVRRTETSGELKIYIFDISKDELAADLRSTEQLAETALYRKIVETGPDEPWSLVGGSYAFGAVVDDTACLVRMSKIAAAANAPFVSQIRPEILGISGLAGNEDPKAWDMSADHKAGMLWATIRGLPESKYLGLTMPRFLARLPYGIDSDPLETFAFEEFSGEPEHDNYVWANACFAVAMLCAQSFSEYGWEMGRSLLQDIDAMPVHVYDSGGETVFKPCAEVQLTQAACERLMDYGVMPLVSYKNSDRVKVARFQSIADPVTGLRGRWSS